MQFNLKAASAFQKIRELQESLVPINEEITRAEEAAKLEPCICKHDLTADPAQYLPKEDPPAMAGDGWHLLDTGRCVKPGCKCREAKPNPATGGYERRFQVVSEILSIGTLELRKARIETMVAGVQSLKIDGVAATVPLLLEKAPEVLAAEVDDEIKRLLSLSPDEILGFKSPTTTGAQVDGQIPTVL